MFELHNDTILRGYLAHVASLLRKAARLRGAAEAHPDNTPERSAERAKASKALAISQLWDQLATDLRKVLDLRLFTSIDIMASAGDVYAVDPANGQKDTTRLTMGQLYKLAEKARRKDPTIKLLGSWDYDAMEKKALDALRARRAAGDTLDAKQEARLVRADREARWG